MSRRPRFPLPTAHVVRCANEECEAEITVHVYPAQRETRECPGFPATIDTPRICPTCGALIDNDTADGWLTDALERDRDRDGENEEKEER